MYRQYPFAAITGTPVHFDVEWGNLNSLSNETCDREDRTVLLAFN